MWPFDTLFAPVKCNFCALSDAPIRRASGHDLQPFLELLLVLLGAYLSIEGRLHWVRRFAVLVNEARLRPFEAYGEAALSGQTLRYFALSPFR